MKNTKGTQLPSGAVVIKGPTTQQIRCPKCRGTAAAVAGASGKPHYHCSSCGRNFSSQSI